MQLVSQQLAWKIGPYNRAYKWNVLIFSCKKLQQLAWKISLCNRADKWNMQIFICKILLLQANMQKWDIKKLIIYNNWCLFTMNYDNTCSKWKRLKPLIILQHNTTVVLSKSNEKLICYSNQQIQVHPLVIFIRNCSLHYRFNNHMHRLPSWDFISA